MMTRRALVIFLAIGMVAIALTVSTLFSTGHREDSGNYPPIDTRVPIQTDLLDSSDLQSINELSTVGDDETPEIQDGQAVREAPFETPVSTWPKRPEDMEIVFRDELATIGELKSVSSMAIHCSLTGCEIDLSTVGEQGESLLWRLRESFLQLPFGVNVEAIIIRQGHQTSAGKITLRSDDFSSISYADDGNVFGLSPERLNQLADYALPDGQFDTPIAIIETGYHTIAVQNVCSYDCPLDSRRVVHVQAFNAVVCQLLGGLHEDIVVRTESGVFQERGFCLAPALNDHESNTLLD
jgi:hypothetical protein